MGEVSWFSARFVSAFSEVKTQKGPSVCCQSQHDALAEDHLVRTCLTTLKSKSPMPFATVRALLRSMSSAIMSFELRR